MEYELTGSVISRDGARLFWGERGKNQSSKYSIVLCDGIACDGFAWKYIQPALSAHHRVLHWHYRGHGRSEDPKDPERIDVPSHAEDLLDILKARSIEEAVVIGHSMGTQVALELYRIAPWLIRGMVLLCGSDGRITASFHRSDWLERNLPRLIEWAEKRQRALRAIWRRVPTGLAYAFASLLGEINADALSKKDFALYHEHVTKLNPLLFLRMLEKAGQHSAKDVLNSIQVPVLVIAGDLDTFTPPERSREMAKAIPGAEFVLIRGATHAAPVEYPDIVIQEITRFLNERVEKSENKKEIPQ